MEISNVLRALTRNWWIVAGATVVALGIAVTQVMLAVPQYATSLTFFVTARDRDAGSSYQSDLFSQQRVKSYVSVLTGDRLARTVAAANLGLSAPEVQRRIRAEAVSETVLLNVTVTDQYPARSKRLATQLAKDFAALVNDLETTSQNGQNGQADRPAINVDVVAGPTLSATPVSPRPVRSLAVAGLLGLLAGLAGAVLRDRLDATIKTADALRNATGVPCLAVVPFDATAKRAPLVAGNHVGSPYAESFRHLRTNLRLVDLGNPVRVVVVTSSVAEEGKSVTTANLGLACAEADRRVLLVEADLRKPRLSSYLGIESTAGLSDVLIGREGVDDVLVRTERNGLYVLPAGSIPSNPSELLGGQTMRSLLERQRERFDVVIVDTPPLLPVTDAAVLAAHADGAVLVVRAGKTPQAKVRAAIANLRAVDARLLGCVLNLQPGRTLTGYPYDHQEPVALAAEQR